MGTLTMRDGVELAVRDEGSGPVLLLVPGWAVSGWWFREQFAEALTSHYRVVCYDPRGQGESEKTDRGQRLARLAADLAEVLEYTGERQVHLLGWSGGASTALQYVELYGTERLASLTLSGGGPRLMKGDGWDLGFMDLDGAKQWVDLIRDNFEAAARGIVPQFFAAELAPDVLEATVTEMLKCQPSAMSKASWDFLNQDVRDVLPQVNVPTLVITGDADTAVPAGNAPYLAENIADSKLVVIEAASHCPFLEQPAEFNNAVTDFIAAHPPR